VEEIKDGEDLGVGGNIIFKWILKDLEVLDWIHLA
jgi:hypothetical protein